MPELPEVETLTRSFKIVEGSLIHNIEVHFPKLRSELDIHNLSALKKVKVINCYRRAKYMIWKLDNSSLIVFHLGMSGTLRRREPGQLIKHDHVVIHIGPETYAFNDPRRFGMIWWFASENDFLSKRKLGIEPLSSQFNGEYLAQLIKNKKSKIKSILFDQTLIAGLGNIYINEALFISRILPQRLASELSLTDCENLVRAIKDCLSKAVQAGGSTLADFQNIDGEKGWFQNQHLVYNKSICSNCNSPITREVLAGRSTYACYVCQS